MIIRHDTIRLLVVLIVAVSLLAACDESSLEPTGTPTSAPVSTPTPTATPIPEGFSALELLHQSTDAMAEVQSLRATMDGELISPEESAAWAMEMEVAADGTTRIVMTVTSAVDGLDVQQQFEVIQSSTYVYLKDPVTGWVRASIEAADLPSSTFDSNLFLDLFKDEDIPWEYISVEALGQEDIHGVSAEHLQVRVDFQALMQAQMQELQEGMGEQEAAMSELFQALTALIPPVELELWVDQQGFVRKQHMQMSMGTEIAVTVNVEIFDINEEVVIDLPQDFVETDEPLSIPDLRG